MDTPTNQIADLEIEIDHLTEAAGRCRKIAVLAQVAVGAGGLFLLGMIIGVVHFSSEAMVLTITAVLGGIALNGTNQSTLDEITDKIGKAEAHREALIDSLKLQAVEPI